MSDLARPAPPPRHGPPAVHDPLTDPTRCPLPHAVPSSRGRHRPQPRGAWGLAPGSRRRGLLAALVAVGGTGGIAVSWSNASVHRSGHPAPAASPVAAAAPTPDPAVAARAAQERRTATDLARLLAAVKGAESAAARARTEGQRAQVAWDRVAANGPVPSLDEQTRTLAAAHALAAAPAAGTAGAAGAVAPGDRWVPPVDGYVLTSGFKIRWGRLHAGIDLAVPVGTPVRAMSGARVVYAGEMPGYGTAVDLLLADGVLVRHGHLSTLLVTTGQEVAAGQVVALSGNTGHSTGPHLHLEIHPRGTQAGDDVTDPLPVLAAHGVVVTGADAVVNAPDTYGPPPATGPSSDPTAAGAPSDSVDPSAVTPAPPAPRPAGTPAPHPTTTRPTARPTPSATAVPTPHPQTPTARPTPSPRPTATGRPAPHPTPAPTSHPTSPAAHRPASATRPARP